MIVKGFIAQVYAWPKQFHAFLRMKFDDSQHDDDVNVTIIIKLYYTLNADTLLLRRTEI